MHKKSARFPERFCVYICFKTIILYKDGYTQKRPVPREYIHSRGNRTTGLPAISVLYVFLIDSSRWQRCYKLLVLYKKMWFFCLRRVKERHF